MSKTETEIQQQHHQYSASGAEGWLSCPGKLTMEKGIVEQYSPWADEGSAAHYIGAESLIQKVKPFTFVGKVVICWEKEGERDGQILEGEVMPEGATERSRWPVTKDMAENLQMYVDTVSKYAREGTLLVERRVFFGDAIGVAGAFGTSDASILKADGKEIIICDLKYGHSKVSAEDNSQMMLYALGVLHDFEWILDFDSLEKITVVIIQPRIPEPISQWSCTLKELVTFAERCKTAVAVAEEAESTFEFPSQWYETQGEWEKEYLKPSEKGCKWCKAKPCSSLTRESLNSIFVPVATAEGLEDLDSPETDILATVASDEFNDSLEEAIARVEHFNFETISKLYGSIGRFEIWVKAIETRMLTDMLEGEKHRDWKLVKGREGNRKWTDELEVERIMKVAKFKVDEMYDRTLISATSAEKLTKTKPKIWNKLKPWIGRSEGKISVAAMSDKRPSLDPYNEGLAGLPDLSIPDADLKKLEIDDLF